MSESRVTWATSVPILVSPGLSALRPDVRDRRQTSDRCQTSSSLNASALWGRRHNKALDYLLSLCWFFFALDHIFWVTCNQGLKCNFMIVGTVKIPGPPVRICSCWPLSFLQRAPVFLVTPLSRPNSDWYFIGKFELPWIKLCFRPGNMRSHRIKRSLRPGNARLRKWRVCERCTHVVVPTLTAACNAQSGL